MLMTGCDYHPNVQQVAFVDTPTGECRGAPGIVPKLNVSIANRSRPGGKVRFGMEATGH